MRICPSEVIPDDTDTRPTHDVEKVGAVSETIFCVDNLLLNFGALCNNSSFDHVGEYLAWRWGTKKCNYVQDCKHERKYAKDFQTGHGHQDITAPGLIFHNTSRRVEEAV